VTQNISKTELTEIMRRMMRIRHFEDNAMVLHKNGEIRGSLHTSQGQEGEIVGACSALRLDDYMVGNHRSHGHPIGKGAKLRGLMAELLARETGVCHGKGGSMHLADFSVGSLGETSIVGSGIPVAAGAALGAKMLGLDRVCLCFFGDGAAQEGTFHEGINMAAIWKLPAIFLCENNGYAVSTSIGKSTLVTNIADRAPAYGIPGISVDGQDVLAVRAAVADAVTRARCGEGPTLIEAKTYRYFEHAVNLGRDFRYRTDAEIQEWQDQRDPIVRFRARLKVEFDFSELEIVALDQEAQSEVLDAIGYARESPFPDPSQAFTDVYAPAAQD
jgi:TPP-dependent pyruvate/acetoin dehydrogenase alpha subunit